MICNHLIQAAKTLVQLQPSPSLMDITRVVCGSCSLTACCPSLTVEQAEAIDGQSGSTVHQSTAAPSTEF